MKDKLQPFKQSEEKMVNGAICSWNFCKDKLVNLLSYNNSSNFRLPLIISQGNYLRKKVKKKLTDSNFLYQINQICNSLK